MEVQIFGIKKDSDTRKALRFFAERRVKTHFVDQFGLRYDRRWMVVDESGRFLSQRSHVRLALVMPSIRAETLLWTRPACRSWRRRCIRLRPCHTGYRVG